MLVGVVFDKLTAAAQSPGDTINIHVRDCARETLKDFRARFRDFDVRIFNKEGRVVYSGVPFDAVKELEGRIWERSVEKDELAQFREAHHVLSTKLVAGRPLIRVLDDQDPGNGFVQVKSDLDDVFFAMTRNHL